MSGKMGREKDVMEKVKIDNNAFVYPMPMVLAGSVVDDVTPFHSFPISKPFISSTYKLPGKNLDGKGIKRIRWIFYFF